MGDGTKVTFWLRPCEVLQPRLELCSVRQFTVPMQSC